MVTHPAIFHSQDKAHAKALWRRPAISILSHVEARFRGVFKATRVTLITRQFIKINKAALADLASRDLQAPDRKTSDPFSRAREPDSFFLFTFLCIFIHVSWSPSVKPNSAGRILFARVLHKKSLFSFSRLRVFVMKCVLISCRAVISWN